MKNYISGVIGRSVRHFFFFIGRFLILSFLLIFVSSGIRGEGGAVLGKVYYYAVMPGVVCHETAHAAACLCTGMKIVEFAPFRPHGDVLGYVQWDPGRVTLWTFIAAFLIGTAPLWFGCAVVWLICRSLVKTRFLPDFRFVFADRPHLSGFPYWKSVAKSAFFMAKYLLQKGKFSSWPYWIASYLLFCVISEMAPSIPDLRMALPGIGLLALMIVLLNGIPWMGTKIDRLTVLLQPLFFTMHVVVFFVFLLDILFFLCIVIPVSILC